MRNVLSSLSWRSAVAALGMMLAVAPLRGAVLWNEMINGDLSDNQALPNAFLLGNGTNSIIGTVGGGNNRDWVALTVPASFQLSSLYLVSYASSDQRGFIGVQMGNAFIGDPLVASNYLGYAHFGPFTGTVGTDILPYMGNTVANPGSTGFTPPLGSATYVFLIQQTGSAFINYQFDFNVTPVPEPAGLAIGLLAGGLLLFKRRRPGRRAN